MKPIISESGEGILIPLEHGSLVRFKILARDTDHAFEMYEREVPPHTIGADPHYHEATDETFYVVSGTATIQVGEKRRPFAAGSIVVVPRQTVHGYWNETAEPIKLLITFCPGLDHERFFQGLSRLKAGPPDRYVDDLAALRKEFGSVSVPDGLEAG
jgi:quercetin dioxygenase-like cupin family protein